MKELMSGLQAVVFSLLDSNVRIATGVPGFPITEIMENIGKKIKHEWSVNEKIALEIVLGSSLMGVRGAVITKHVGMNILSDPLVTSATHTIGAGVVIIAGDDAGVQKSQNEQDSRNYGLVAEVPVFDPSTPETAYRSIMEAFELSEKVSAPAIIRITDRFLKSEGNIERSIIRPEKVSFDKNIWQLTMLGKHQRFHKISFPRMCEYAESSTLNRFKIKGNVGIISSGYPSSLVESLYPGLSHLSLCVINPLPLDMINRFIDEHRHVLVVEETEPVIERQLSRKVMGKLTGHMPYGIVEAVDIMEGIKNISKGIVLQHISPQTIEKRGARPICDDCPYLPLYKAVKELNVPVAGDLGCSIFTSAPPLSLIDAAFSLGSSISTASGFDRKGIAIIGDFGFAHSGIPGLVNAVQNYHEVVVIVLQNEVSAMTGGQSVPDLSGLISSYIKDTEIIDPQADADLKCLLENKLKKKGICVIIARAKCPKY
ncbi:MAG: indolepyruvate ferredoxin oxidoreductase subunit alpha [Candidatus Methanoperedens sp.]|nr:indolepyruvate ferredoxin oxidoreductase subunit alpha [Candidatus Methanoperedens sp.]